MAEFNYRQDVTIPRIVFGRGLANNLDHATLLTKSDMVLMDGELVNDVDRVLEVGQHMVTVIEHREEKMVQAKTPPSRANPTGTEEKWEWVTVPEKSAEFNTIPVIDEDEK